ncbi:hypothetical protein B0H14DRAFT_2983477, partial [Mycena olivaceomarginata]
MGSLFPGSFSEELVPQQQNSESTLLDTANGRTYLPVPGRCAARRDERWAGREDLLAAEPGGVSPLGVVLESRNRPRSSPADVPVTDDSALRTPSTAAQAGSLPPARRFVVFVLRRCLCLRRRLGQPQHGRAHRRHRIPAPCATRSRLQTV